MGKYREATRPVGAPEIVGDEGRNNVMTDFMECDTCRAKSGTPVLCAGCLHNRELVGRLRKSLEPVNAPELVRIEEQYGREAFPDAGSDIVRSVQSLLSHIAYLQGIMLDMRDESSAYWRGVEAGLGRAAAVMESEAEEFQNISMNWNASSLRTYASTIRRQQRCEACRGVGALVVGGTRRTAGCEACGATGWVTAKEVT